MGSDIRQQRRFFPVSDCSPMKALRLLARPSWDICQLLSLEAIRLKELDMEKAHRICEQMFQGVFVDLECVPGRIML